MQLQLPLFPKSAKLISSVLGVYEQDGLVQYIVNGLPVYAHGKEDLEGFRFITSNFIHQKLCKQTEVQRCFQVSPDSVQRAYNKFVSEGEKDFFGKDNRKGVAHKLGSRIERIQRKLDKGQSVLSIAKEEAIRQNQRHKEHLALKKNNNETYRNRSETNQDRERLQTYYENN